MPLLLRAERNKVRFIVLHLCYSNVLYISAEEWQRVNEYEELTQKADDEHIEVITYPFQRTLYRRNYHSE